MTFWFTGPSKLARVQGIYVRHLSRSPTDSRGASRNHLLWTLDPTRLKTPDYVDISSRRHHVVKVGSRDRNTPGISAYPAFSYYKCKGVSSAFPPRTAGYFYYHQPKDAPFTAGAIRFRVASVNPATFPKGRDLLRPDGVPWEIPLPTIAKSRPILKQLLLQEKLVTKAQLKECAKMFPSRRSRPPKLLHHFSQPFSVKFEGVSYVQVICGGQNHRFVLRVFHEQRKGTPSSLHPYSGIALVRFELSALPQYANARVAVLRVVKMIEPPKLRVPNYDGYLPCPEEGQLVCRPRHRGAKGTVPWSKKLDSPRGKTLALLLDSEEVVKPSP
ncbi:hypothetical protein C8R47DRAFT_647376 [Mycena vitilis]|nr:hypothetical protein C8R47DRAFT_647376 [Mycena vitilis]